MPSLVTLQEAKRAVRITHVEDDAELYRILQEAEVSVLDAVKNRVSDAEAWEAIVDGWDQDTVPHDVKGAILHQFVAAERFRGGDDPKAEPVWVHGIAPRAWAIVQKYRDPSIA